MKKMLLSVAFMLFLSPNLWGQETTPSIELLIQSDKEIYKVGEEISLKLTWANNSEFKYYLFYSEVHEGRNLTIKDEFDKSLPIFQTSERKRGIGVKNFKLLNPTNRFSSSILGKIDIPERFNYPYKSKEESAEFHILNMNDTACYVKGGNYQIQYHYVNEGPIYDDNGQIREVENVWVGRVDSNVITVTLEIAENSEVQNSEKFEMDERLLEGLGSEESESKEDSPTLLMNESQ